MTTKFKVVDLPPEAPDQAAGCPAADNQRSGKTWRDGLITARELQTKQFKPVRIILPELIPEGVTILAGKPKIGKSWLMLDVCVAVAGGRFVLGDKKPVQGDVLYLALEDNQRRLKKRMDKLIGDYSWPERLDLHTEWKRLDQGGLEDFEEWCKAKPERRLICIDTLAKMRPLVGRNEQAYAADYRAIEGLQRIAGQYQVGIVLTHHLRKASSEDDAFDDVSGTLGLTGAADTIVIMKRHSGMVKVYVRGRDIEEGEFAAEFNPESCRWRLVGAADEVFRSQERQIIIAALRSADEPMSISDIMAATERTDRNATKSLLHKMKTAGEVISERGCYSLAPTDLLNSVDRVDWEPVSAAAVNPRPHNATVSGMANGQRNGQRAVNGQRSIDRALTGTNKDKPLNAASNSDPGQRVNAVIDIPRFLDRRPGAVPHDRRPALGPPGDSLDDLQ
jgi:AAA domain